MNLPLSVANHTYIYLYVSHCLGLTRSQADTFLHCNIAPLWYRYASAVALGAAWLSFYQILALFKWMIPVLRRDQRTKSPLFLSDPLLSLFLPCPSLKAQLQSFVTPPKKKRLFFFPSQDSLQGHILQDVLGPSQRNRHPCGVITSAVFPTLCCFPLFLDMTFLPKAHRTGENRSYTSAGSPRVRMWTNTLYENVNLFTFQLEFMLCLSLRFSTSWFCTGLRHAVILTHTYCTFFQQLPKSMRDNRTIWQSTGLLELISAYLSN